MQRKLWKQFLNQNRRCFDKYVVGQYHTNRYTIWENDNTDICLYEENITHKYTDAVVIEMLAVSKTRLLKKRNRVQAENQRKKTIDNLIF